MRVTFSAISSREACVMMGTAPDEVKQQFITSDRVVYERVVEFPLWDDYNQYIQSDIADIKNVGGTEAGAITAGKFLEHFTAYDWIRLDIAGSVFVKSADHYRSPNGTGYGVRLLYNFVKSFLSKQFKAYHALWGVRLLLTENQLFVHPKGYAIICSI